MKTNYRMFGAGIIEVTRWLLIAILITTSWLWGGTRPWTQDLVARMLLFDTALFLLALIAAGRFPRLNRIMLVSILLLLALGWLASLNAYPGPGGMRVLMPRIPGRITSFPAFLDRDISLRAMMMYTGILGALCISCDLSANPKWRMRLWKLLALNGFGIVLLGLLQRFTHAPAIYWNVYENNGPYFFAVFRYHANAGAFINLMGPVLVGLAVLSVILRWIQAERVIWITGALFTCAAAFINASRAANFIALLLVIFGTGWILARSLGKKGASRISERRVVTVLGGGILVLVTVILSFGAEMAVTRWAAFRGISWNQDRVLVYRMIIDHLVPKSGFFGVGPGNFEAAFASVVQAGDLPVVGRWDLAHNDYLQGLVEWGWVGFACWVLILGGGLIKAFLLACRANSGIESRTMGMAGSLALGGVLLHAGGDFPLQITSIQLCVMIMCGLFLGHPVQGLARKRKVPKSSEEISWH